MNFDSDFTLTIGGQAVNEIMAGAYRCQEVAKYDLPETINEDGPARRSISRRIPVRSISPGRKPSIRASAPSIRRKAASTPAGVSGPGSPSDGLG